MCVRTRVCVRESSSEMIKNDLSKGHDYSFIKISINDFVI